MQEIKILQVTGGFRKGVSGGIPSMLHNFFLSSAFDRGFHFDYLSLGYQTFEPYRKDFEKKGSILYCLDIHIGGMRRLFEIYRKLKKFLRSTDYDIVHINSGALTQVLAACMAAKKAKSKVVIAHSHNAINKQGVKGVIYNCLKVLFYLFADQYFACSDLAAKSMFPKGIIKNQKWIFIPNAVDIERFLYNEQIRNRYRKEMNLTDRFIIGHVGRFNIQKNHEFLVNVFAEIAQRREDAVLLLVGCGDLLEDIRKKVIDLNLQEKVIFTGRREDVNCLMQIMDVFVMPSKWEGLPVTVVEAQVSGLRCVLSENITKEVKCSDLVSYISLDEGIESWVEAIDSKVLKRRCSMMMGSKFDVSVSGMELAKLYKCFICA